MIDMQSVISDLDQYGDKLSVFIKNYSSTLSLKIYRAQTHSHRLNAFQVTQAQATDVSDYSLNSINCAPNDHQSHPSWTVSVMSKSAGIQISQTRHFTAVCQQNSVCRIKSHLMFVGFWLPQCLAIKLHSVDMILSHCNDWTPTDSLYGKKAFHSMKLRPSH